MIKFSEAKMNVPNHGEQNNDLSSHFTRELSPLFLHSFSIKQIISQNIPNSFDSILPIDFFTFLIGPSVIGNGDFINPPALLGYLGCDFWFKSKSVLFDFYAI